MSKIIVAAVAAYFRGDQPDGVSTGITFADDSEGMSFCEALEGWFQQTGASEADARYVLAWYAPRKHDLSFEEARAVIRAVYYLRRTGRILADEYNGPAFFCLLPDAGAVVSSERNPATCDVAAECHGDGSVDVTQELRAARRSGFSADAIRAIRVVTDHARGSHPARKGYVS